ncbi:hypothetical protein [Natrinema longum]|uniref:Uncharacterized protein n=1 Tax=Natrinema longum TaxID=370324 RepID=A0A8A2UDK4_9EURY|nr:hypothetical protein [Natrinema longum]MBZ6495327.1 hypothetical protein [Natrinema longum]QSW86700.1 hypothetical protein J0X27_07775 [Natrinema longum]
MESPDDTAERTSRSRLRRLAVPLVFGLLCSPLIVGLSVVVGPVTAAGALVALIGLVAFLSWRRSTLAETTSRTESETEDEPSTVWNAIPSWQYEGRHVEAGGIARGEQERALQDIQQQAQELSNEPSRE